MTATRIAGLLTLAMLACLGNGCGFGMTAKSYRPAQGPEGVNMRVQTAQEQLSGELLEVRDTGIVVLADRKVRLIPYTAILSASPDQTETGYPFSIRRQTAPKPEVREYLRLRSRFPQGLTPELMRQLLDVYGQTELAGAKP